MSTPEERARAEWARQLFAARYRSRNEGEGVAWDPAWIGVWGPVADVLMTALAASEQRGKDANKAWAEQVAARAREAEALQTDKDTWHSARGALLSDIHDLRAKLQASEHTLQQTRMHRDGVMMRKTQLEAQLQASERKVAEQEEGIEELWNRFYAEQAKAKASERALERVTGLLQEARELLGHIDAEGVNSVQGHEVSVPRQWVDAIADLNARIAALATPESPRTEETR